MLENQYLIYVLIGIVVGFVVRGWWNLLLTGYRHG